MNQTKCVLSAILLLTVSMIGLGCGAEEEKKAQAPDAQTRRTAPPRPTTRTVDQLTSALSIDDRIYLDEEEAPRTEKQRIAILNFFNAMLHTDVGTMKSMLSYSDQLELEVMIDAGLSTSMDTVSLVELKTGDSPEGRMCVMAIYEIDFDYQVQLWYLDESGASTTFSAVDTPPNLVDKLSGNWIQNYFELKLKQAEIAQQPDAETSYTLAGDLTSSDGKVGTDNNLPSNPGSPGRPRGPFGQ